MGKRSRRQRRGGADNANGNDEGRAAALRRRTSAAATATERNIKARPPAPWDPFPLTELSVLFGLICLGIAFFTTGDLRRAMMAAGFTLAALGGLDTVLREHFNGYRQHAGMLAGILALMALIASTALVSIGIVPRAAIAIGVFALSYPPLRRGFIRRAGGRRA